MLIEGTPTTLFGLSTKLPQSLYLGTQELILKYDQRDFREIKLKQEFRESALREALLTSQEQGCWDPCALFCDSTRETGLKELILTTWRPKAAKRKELHSASDKTFLPLEKVSYSENSLRKILWFYIQYTYFIKFFSIEMKSQARDPLFFLGNEQ